MAAKKSVEKPRYTDEQKQDMLAIYEKSEGNAKAKFAEVQKKHPTYKGQLSAFTQMRSAMLGKKAKKSKKADSVAPAMSEMDKATYKLAKLAVIDVLKAVLAKMG